MLLIKTMKSIIIIIILFYFLMFVLPSYHDEKGLADWLFVGSYLDEKQQAYPVLNAMISLIIPFIDIFSYAMFTRFSKKQMKPMIFLYFLGIWNQ